MRAAGAARQRRRRRASEGGAPPLLRIVLDQLLGALALLLIVEGLLPFVNPRGWRRVFEAATRLNDGQIRFVGLASMLVGLALLFVFWR